MKNKKTSFSVMILATVVASIISPVNAKTITEALKSGTTTINTRVFYFNRGFDKPDVKDAEALTAGGIMKYESGSIGNFKVGLGYYGSHSLFNTIDREKAGGTSLLQSNGEDITLLGEAYVDFDTGTNQIKAGRQRLSTPLMNDHDLRMLPSTYEAIVYRNKSIPNTVIETGYVSRYSGFGSKLNKFDSQYLKWGTDGLAYISGKTKLENISLQGQYIETLDDTGIFNNYSYLDTKIPIHIGEKTYLKAQYGGTGYQTGKDSNMFGLKAGTSFGPIDAAIVYNKIENNIYRAVEAGPMYTDWQQGYGNYEPSDAVGLQLIYHPSSKASIKAGYVDVESKDGDSFNLDSYKEFNFDAKYRINKSSKVRLRFSSKKQDQNSNREDRNDFRVIYSHDF